jgi:hypothetical protein
MKEFVEHISGLSPATIRDYSNVVKAVVASAINEDGECLFPRTWNEEFIDAPTVKHQRQPSTNKEGMESILREATGQYRALYALLAGCGPLRVGEALGLEIGKHISEDCRTFSIQQKAKRGKIQPYLKTENGEREVDLCTSLAAMLKDHIGARTSGLHVHRRATPSDEYPSRQSPSHPQKTPTRNGRVQYLSALPNHSLEQVRLP